MDPYFAERTVKDDNGCWIWTGCVTNKGYGQAAGGKPAHRRSYEVHVGPIPDGLLIRHLCDTPLCCNPLHLVPGNTSQNWFDMTEEKRKETTKKAQASTRANNPHHHRDMGRKGGGHNRLKPEQVKSRMDQIAHLDPTKRGYVKQVSEIWGVSHTQVRRILNSIPSTEQANGPDC